MLVTLSPIVTLLILDAYLRQAYVLLREKSDIDPVPEIVNSPVVSLSVQLKPLQVPLCTTSSAEATIVMPMTNNTNTDIVANSKPIFLFIVKSPLPTCIIFRLYDILHPHT